MKNIFFLLLKPYSVFKLHFIMLANIDEDKIYTALTIHSKSYQQILKTVLKTKH